MSRITFASPTDDAELRGSERAYMGLLISRITTAIFDPWSLEPRRAALRKMTGLDMAAYDDRGGGLYFARDFETFLAVGGDRKISVGDRSVGVFTVCLNTAWLIGDDALKLIARLHGQCELHAWVDGPNRRWLADIITRGRASRVLRAGQGWEGVAAFLRESESEPVVTSYSVTDGFPNPYVADFDGDPEEFYDLSRDDQWARCMAALRANDGAAYGLELRPDEWSYEQFQFGDGSTAFSLLDEIEHPATPAAREGE